MRCALGDRVTCWTSKYGQVTGEVVTIVPRGKRPTDCGHLLLGDTTTPRHVESYVVRATVSLKQGRKTVRSNRVFWPNPDNLGPAVPDAPAPGAA